MILKGCSSATRRKQCHKVNPSGFLFEKQGTLQSLSQMVQGYKTSNSTDTGPRTTGNGGQFPKGSVLFSYSGKKGECGTLSCKDDDRHPYDKRNTDTATKLNLPELEKSGRETGGTMLNVTGMNRFYYLRNFHDESECMTLVNWLAKGAAFTSALIERLKDRAMVKDSIVNCDETWCKVKMNRHFLKEYVWCLVNKEQKIVIYCYEDGSRGRKVLKRILKDRQVKALQSDGYNVYMYIDKELVDTEHLCCLAHARAKFVYAYEQGDDPDAKSLIDFFGELYRLEDTYKLSGLSAQEITRCRHSLRTEEIIGRIRSKLDVLLSPTHPPRGELMDKAVNYLQVFRKQLFAYLNDGRYDIDNSIAERFIRPLAGERKNSLFFVGSRMANVSAAYHTLLSTCRMNGLSALEYLKKFFHEIVKGRKDYENLLPMTIGINTNKY